MGEQEAKEEMKKKAKIKDKLLPRTMKKELLLLLFLFFRVRLKYSRVGKCLHWESKHPKWIAK